MKTGGSLSLALIVIISLAASFVPTRAHAVIYDEVDRYYNTCGTGRYVVGEEHYDCDGVYSSWGVTSSYMEEIDTNCNTNVVHHYYFECGGQVSSLDTCTC